MQKLILGSFFGVIILLMINGCATTEKGVQPKAERPNINAGLVAWYKFDEGEGKFVRDSANGHNGLIRGAVWTAGKIDGALDFDGVNDYVEMGDTVKRYLAKNYTVTAWIKTNTLWGNHQVASYRDSQSQTGQPPLIFQLDQADADVRFIVADNYQHLVEAKYSNALTEGKWYHIAGVRSGDTLEVYVNGVKGKTGRGAIKGEIRSDNLKIGALLCHGSPVIFFFDGVIDDVRIYNRALTVEEIKALRKSGEQMIVYDVR